MCRGGPAWPPCSTPDVAVQNNALPNVPDSQNGLDRHDSTCGRHDVTRGGGPAWPPCSSRRAIPRPGAVAQARRSCLHPILLAPLVLALAIVGCSGGRSNGSAAAPTSVATGLIIGTQQSGDAANASPTPAAEPTADATSAPPDLSGRATCAAPKLHAPGNSDETIDSGGQSRHYILHVPPSYDGTRQTPLVLNLHGAGSNAAQQAAYSRFPQKGDAEGFIVVTPDALGTPRAWNFIPLSSQADDIGFIRDILDRMDSQFCIDDARVYSTGISSGAAMSERLACALQDRIAAIGPVSALFYPANCPTGRAVAVIEFHGTEDKVVKFTGGPTVGGLSSPDIQFAASQWAQADGCNTDPERAQLSEHVTSVIYTGCKGGASVVLDIVDGGGHTWPGAAVNVASLGATTHEVSATDEIWKFFAAHERMVPSP